MKKNVQLIGYRGFVGISIWNSDETVPESATDINDNSFGRGFLGQQGDNTDVLFIDLNKCDISAEALVILKAFKIGEPVSTEVSMEASFDEDMRILAYAGGPLSLFDPTTMFSSDHDSTVLDGIVTVETDYPVGFTDAVDECITMDTTKA